MIVRFFKLIIFLLLGVLFLAVLALGLIQHPKVQSEISRKILEKINQKQSACLELDSLSIDFFGNVHLHNLGARDSTGLKFVQIKEVKANLSYVDLYLKKDQLKIKHLSLDEPKLELITYKGAKKSNLTQLIESLSDPKKEKNPNFVLSGDVDIFSGVSRVLNYNQKDFLQLDAQKIFADINAFSSKNNRISARIEDLSFQAKKHNKIYDFLRFRARVLKDESRLDLEDFLIKTKGTNLSGNLKLNFDPKKGLKNFAKEVLLKMNLNQGSVVSDYDLTYFIPDWEKQNTTEISFKNASGTLENLHLEEFSAQSKQFKLLATKLDLFQVLSPGESEISSKNLDLSSSYANLKAYLPKKVAQKIPEILLPFGQIHYVGDFFLNKVKIVSNAKITTQKGSLDLNAKALI
ncbi:MAG: hypothetical protein C4K58_02150 [Flavobacteriaceae bacterium]|nr:MAG: hypothetical protein C4K58_02150 [Flavobacteriaceae bacterium]